jgi:hypothetical protein
MILLTNKEDYMRKKMSKTKKVIQFMTKNPDAKPKAIAQATGVSAQMIYQIAHNLRKKAGTPTAATKATKTITVVKAKSSAADMVNHPPHYKAGGVETIDFIEAKGLGYHLGNVIKYVSRADLKGAKLEDLKKAQWYLNRAVSNLENRA